MNEFENPGFVRKNAVWVVVLVVVAVFGLLLFKGWDQVVNEKVDSMTTVTGNFSCLPLKDGTPDTQCTLGVRGRDGLYYALDISRIQDANMDLKAEDTIAVTGVVLPESEVVGSRWEAYDVRGIVKVNTLLRTR